MYMNTKQTYCKTFLALTHIELDMHYQPEDLRIKFTLLRPMDVLCALLTCTTTYMYSSATCVKGKLQIRFTPDALDIVRVHMRKRFREAAFIRS